MSTGEPHQLHVRSTREGDEHIVAVFGELDMLTAPQLERELEAVEQSDASRIVVDLSGLAFMDSSGLRLLLHASARARADGNRLALLRGPRAVHRVITATGMERQLPFVD